MTTEREKGGKSNVRSGQYESANIGRRTKKKKRATVVLGYRIKRFDTFQNIELSIYIYIV